MSRVTQLNETCNECAAKGRAVQAFRDGLCEPHYYAVLVARSRQRPAESYWDRFRPGGRPKSGSYWDQFTREGVSR